MKRSVLLWGLMCLLSICTWAKEMTVQITDTKDLPVPGIKVSIPGYTSDGAGHYTTDANGKFVVNRSSLDFLQMHIDEKNVSDSYELVWNGGNDPVVVKLEGYYWLTMELKGVESEQYSLFSGVNLYTNKSSLYNEIYLETEWTDNGTFSFLYKGKQLYWELVGSILGVTSNITVDVTALNDGRIEINAPMEGKQKLTVAIKDETNALSEGLIKISGPHSYDLTIAAQETDIYLPKDNYEISARITGKEGYYIPIYQELILDDEPVEQTFSYDTGKKVTVRVLDIDGLPVKDAIVSKLIPSSSSWNGQKTDANGEVVYTAVAGTYSYYVLVVSGTDGDIYSLEGEIIVGSEDMEQIISFQNEYFRISLNITTGGFMTDPFLLNVKIGSRNIPYNEQTKLYTSILPKSSENKYYSYQISYPGMFTKEDYFQVTKDETIPISFTNYHKVTFTSSDVEKYALSDIYINETDKQQTYSCSEGKEYYLPEGEFEISATITDLTTQESFPCISKQSFTVSGEDMKVTYTFNENDYHLATISVINRTGSPMAGTNIEILKGYKQNYYTTDEQGEIRLHLPAGTYKCKINLESYQTLEKSFTIEESDVNIKLSFENYMKLTFNVTGDLLEAFRGEYGQRVNPIIKMINCATLYDQYFSLSKGNPTDGFTKDYYLPAGNYIYSLKIQHNNLINTSGKLISVNTDITENISLSTSDFQEVKINVVDEKGVDKAFPKESHIYVCNKMDKVIYSIYPDQNTGILQNVYLPCGKYVAKLIYQNVNDTRSISATEFTIGNEPETVIITCKEVVEELPFTIKVKGMPETYRNQCLLDFYSNGIFLKSYGVKLNNHIGETQAELPEGIYTYRTLSPEGKEMSGTVTIPADKELILDYSDYHLLYVTLFDENGLIIQSDDTEITLYQDNQIIYSDGNNLAGMFPAGVYQIRAWYKGHKAVSQTVTIGEEKQYLINLTLPKESANTYSVIFLLADCDEPDDFKVNAIVTLKGYGTFPVSNGIVFTDVSAGNIPYTISAPGYTTQTGVVSVSAEKAAEYGYVQVFALLKTAPTGVEQKYDVSNDFNVWIADDYLYIRSNSNYTDSWSMQLVSLNGNVVYTDKVQLETVNRFYVGNRPKGIYLFVLSNGKQRIAYKVVKN